MEELELPTFGGDGGDGDQRLEVPPDLDTPDLKETYDIASARRSAMEADGVGRVLPRDLYMRLRSEGNVTWLAVDAAPDGLWPHVVGFWRSHGFEITDESMQRGRIETGWREQKLNAPGAPRVRDMFRMRLERAPNAVTNVYLANRKATLIDGEWQVVFSDHETEIEVLYDLGDYLASRREVENGTMLRPENVRVGLDIENIAGVPVLTIGQSYSRVWRGLGVALERAGLSVRRADRSRGIYLVRYEPVKEDGDGLVGASGSRLLQLRLLSRGGETLVTVHPNRGRGAALAYETAHEVLHSVVRTYAARA